MYFCGSTLIWYWSRSSLMQSRSARSDFKMDIHGSAVDVTADFISSSSSSSGCSGLTSPLSIRPCTRLMLKCGIFRKMDMVSGIPVPRITIIFFADTSPIPSKSNISSSDAFRRSIGADFLPSSETSSHLT